MSTNYLCLSMDGKIIEIEHHFKRDFSYDRNHPKAYTESELEIPGYVNEENIDELFITPFEFEGYAYNNLRDYMQKHNVTSWCIN